MAQPPSASYRRVLWAALAINATMFVVELVGGLRAGSVSLLADAVDFFGDAANYGLSLLVLGMALAWRDGDANMRSVRLCSRNDAIGNVAVMAAALGVFGTGQGWPDLVVAAVMGVLALCAARSVIRQSLVELRPVAVAA
jgi:Co/Zn/Cd efflux system component